MQNSAVSGGKRDDDKPAISSGNLLIRNDLTRLVSWTFSFLKVALARMSKEQRIKSKIVVRRSPYGSSKHCPAEESSFVLDIDCVNMHR